MTTKIAPPVAPRNHVTRPRVTECFRSGPGLLATIVTGPPGIGKTTAVHDWAEEVGRPVAWLALDADDNTPERFWDDVAAAVGRVLPSLATEPDTRRALETCDDDVALVLDDFHALTNMAVVEQLCALIERKPRSVEIVIESRADPPLPLARWRARDELCEVREGDLRFQPDEAVRYLSTFDDLELDEHAITALTERTEGWIAGLQLAVISLRMADDRDTFIDRFNGTDRFVADFLLDEVLARQPRDVTSFLLETSVLPILDPAQCNALTGRDDAEVRLRGLETANLFATRVDRAGTTYRYHPLFRDLLRFELGNHRPARVRQLCDHAARLLADADDMSAAIELFVAAGNHEAALALALPAETELGPSARRAVATRLDMVPTTFVAESSTRMLLYADALQRVGHLEESAVWLRRASVSHRSQGTDDDDDDGFETRCDALWAKWYATDGDAHAALEHGSRALQRRAAASQRREAFLDGLEEIMARSWLILGYTARARRCIERGTAMADGPLLTEVSRPALFARIAALEGRLHDAEVAATRSLRVAEALDVPCHPATVDALLARAFVHRERDDQVGAAVDVDAALALATELSWPPYVALAKIEQARLIATTVGVSEAVEHLHATETSTTGPLRLALATAFGSTAAELALLQGDLERAMRAALSVPLPLERELLVAAVDVASGHPDRARARVQQLQPIHLRNRLRVELIRAVTAPDVAELRRHLGVAVDLGSPEGFRRLFTARGPAVLAGLRSLAVSAELDPSAAELVAALSDLPIVSASATTGGMLSEREHAVLRYLGTALSYYEIASELDISVNTVKTHVKSIHRKLEVSSRSGAVARARELGLFRSSLHSTPSMS